jgi:hypothetical protein
MSQRAGHSEEVNWAPVRSDNCRHTEASHPSRKEGSGADRGRSAGQLKIFWSTSTAVHHSEQVSVAAGVRQGTSEVHMQMGEKVGPTGELMPAATVCGGLLSCT